MSPNERSLIQKAANSFSNNSKTKSTVDSSHNPNTITSMTSQQNSWNASQERLRASQNTRNLLASGSNAYSMSPNAWNKKDVNDYNFSSYDKKAQYMTHGIGGKFESSEDHRISRKPPMHK
jgi:hypothetical protein